MFDHFMCKVGVKIDAWPFWTYIWEGGGGTHRFPPPSMRRSMRRPPPRPMRRPMRRPMPRPMRESTPIYWTFSEILGILEKFMNRTSEKSAFPYWNLVHSSISLQFSPPTAKKAKTKRFYTPPLGRKKRQSLFPPKRIFWQEQISFYVQSRSQNRCLTILCAK